MPTFATARRVRLPAFALSAALAVPLALVLVAGGAGPAGAQEELGKATIKIEASHPAGGTDVHFIVRVTTEDGKAANDALVTAAAFTADGEELTPIRLSSSDEDGHYEGIVQFPAAGQYNLRLTTVGPDGRIIRPVTVAVSPSTTPTTAGASVTTAAGSANGFAPENDNTGGSAAKTAAGDEDSGGGIPAWLIALAAVVVIGGAVSYAVRRAGRAKAAAGTETGADTTEETSADAETAADTTETGADTTEETSADAETAADTTETGADTTDETSADAETAADTTETAGDTETAADTTDETSADAETAGEGTTAAPSPGTDPP